MQSCRVVLAVLLLTPAALGATPLSVIHDDPDAKGEGARLTFLDPTDTTPLGSAPLGVRPISSVFDPETGRLFVANQGKWSVTRQRPLGVGMSLTVIDATTHKRIAEFPLPASPNAIVAAPREGRLFVTCSGLDGEPSVVTVFDRRSLEQIASVSLGPSRKGTYAYEQHTALLSPSGETVFVLRSRAPQSVDAAKKPRVVPTTLVLLDAVTGNVRERRELATPVSQVLLSQDGKTLYVLCSGVGDRRSAAKTGGFGFLYVLDAETGAEITKLDAGFGSVIGIVEENTGRVALLVRAPATGSPFVALLDGATVAAKLELTAPLLLAGIPGSQEHLILTEHELLRVDAPLKTIVARSVLPFPPGSLGLSPDGSLAWVIARKGDRFSSLALPAMKSWRTRTSGRDAVKGGKQLAAASLFVLSFGAAIGGAYAGGMGNVPGFFPYTPRAPNPSFAFSPDGAYLFVYNRQTEDVTIVETSTMSILDMIGVGDGATTMLFPIANSQGVVAVWNKGSGVVEIGAAKKAVVRKLLGVGGSLSWNTDSRIASTGAQSTVTVRNVSAALLLQWSTLALRDGRLWIPREKGFDVVSLETGTIDRKVPVANPSAVLFP